MNVGTLAEQGPEVYQVVLDLQGLQANRGREALKDAKVLQETQDTLVEKVGHCKNIKFLIAKFSQKPDVFDNLKYLKNIKFYSKAKKTIVMKGNIQCTEKTYRNSFLGSRGPQGLPGLGIIANVTRGPSGQPGRTGPPGHHGPDGDGANFYILFFFFLIIHFSFYTLPLK